MESFNGVKSARKILATARSFNYAILYGSVAQMFHVARKLFVLSRVNTRSLAHVMILRRDSEFLDPANQSAASGYVRRIITFSARFIRTHLIGSGNVASVLRSFQWKQLGERRIFLGAVTVCSSDLSLSLPWIRYVKKMQRHYTMVWRYNSCQIKLQFCYYLI